MPAGAGGVNGPSATFSCRADIKQRRDFPVPQQIAIRMHLHDGRVLDGFADADLLRTVRGDSINVKLKGKRSSTRIAKRDMAECYVIAGIGSGVLTGGQG
jgi:hypothetical protein